MNTFTVDSLKEAMSFSEDLYVDNSFLLLPKSGEVTKELIDALREWNIQAVISEGDVSLGASIENLNDTTEPEQTEEKREPIKEIIQRYVKEYKAINKENKEQEHFDMVKKVYEEFMDYIEYIFTHYATHKEIDKDDLSESIQELCIFIRDHKRYILQINSISDVKDKNFLVVHSMRSTVLAIAIAQQLNLPVYKMLELGKTCLIHEIGMLRLPPQLYMKTKKLTPGEKAQISKHTLFGYTIVKELGFPLEVQLGVLEHHEKENGSGYPRKLTGDRISAIAKIISVACSYEAISSPRSYKNEKTTFDALIEMIRNKDNIYDSAVLKALLYTVSFYPIGTYVILSNKKLAVVVESNHDNPKTPIVQLLTETTMDGTPITFMTGTGGVSIVRVLSKKEEEEIIPKIQKKMEEIKKKKQEQLSQKEEETIPEPAEEKEPETKTLNPDGTVNVDINSFLK